MPPSPELLARARRVSLILFDVDGVLTGQATFEVPEGLPVGWYEVRAECPEVDGGRPVDAGDAVLGLLYPLVGALVLSRQPGNLVGRLLMVTVVTTRTSGTSRRRS